MVNNKPRAFEVRLKISLGSVAQGATASADVSGNYQISLTSADLWNSYYTNLCKEFKVKSVIIDYIPANPMDNTKGYVGLSQVKDTATVSGGTSLASFIESYNSIMTPNAFWHGSKRKQLVCTLEGSEKQWKDNSLASDVLANVAWYIMNNAFTAYQTVGILIAVLTVELR